MPPVYTGYPRLLKDVTQEIIKIPSVLSRQRHNQQNIPIFLLARGDLSIYLEGSHVRNAPSPYLRNYKLPHLGSSSPSFRKISKDPWQTRKWYVSAIVPEESHILPSHH